MNDRAEEVWGSACDVFFREQQKIGSDIDANVKAAEVIAAYGQEQRRKGVEAMLRAALDAYYDVDNEKDPDIVMRENADKLIAGLKEKK